ncbi:hypothetical protein A2U01_0044316 [Trifolium medium]|uniref:Uncharacterized protein n=1 Tax=Trifolium medium TaxID=97028 RepID=A0A392QG22_9FABA|nr:hypothetical protein [Trifolium medium]
MILQEAYEYKTVELNEIASTRNGDGKRRKTWMSLSLCLWRLPSYSDEIQLRFPGSGVQFDDDCNKQQGQSGQ